MADTPKIAKALGHDTVDNAAETFDASFVQATDAEGWLAAVWTLRDGRITLEQRTSWNFPNGDLPTAENQLREVNARMVLEASRRPDSDSPPEHAPLPEADALGGIPVPVDPSVFDKPVLHSIPIESLPASMPPRTTYRPLAGPEPVEEIPPTEIPMEQLPANREAVIETKSFGEGVVEGLQELDDDLKQKLDEAKSCDE